MAFPDTETLDPWRDRALDRSLQGARARSADRLERLLVAARELANETGSASFTVAQVAAGAGVSLKIFYRYFESKDDLLVALLEEDSRLGAGILRAVVDANEDRRSRLAAYVTGVFDLVALPGALGYAGVLISEHRRLSEHRPDALARALAPMLDVLAAEIEAAAAEGLVRSPTPARDARTIFVLILDGIHEVVLGRTAARDEAAHLWRLCWAGLRGEPDPPPSEERS